MVLVHLTRFDPFESILFAASRRWKTVGRNVGLFVTMTKPILTVIPLPHPPVEAGVRPSVRTPREAVLDGIVVDVVDVMDHVVFVADRVLPEAFLPDASLPMAPPRRRNDNLAAAVGQPLLGEQHFDARPTHGEITVAFREFPDTVQMVRQQDDGCDLKRVLGLDLADGRVQTPSSRQTQEQRAPPLGDNREEEHPARLEYTSIVRHSTRHKTSRSRRTAQHCVHLTANMRSRQEQDRSLASLATKMVGVAHPT